jgi:hypothetical protein
MNSTKEIQMKKYTLKWWFNCGKEWARQDAESCMLNHKRRIAKFWLHHVAFQIGYIMGY